MALVSKPTSNVSSGASDIQSNIDRLKSILSDEQINTAVRKYHIILKHLRTIDVIVCMDNKEFYKSIFLHALQEEEINNIKDLT